MLCRYSLKLDFRGVIGFMAGQAETGIGLRMCREGFENLTMVFKTLQLDPDKEEGFKPGRLKDT